MPFDSRYLKAPRAYDPHEAASYPPPVMESGRPMLSLGPAPKSSSTERPAPLTFVERHIKLILATMPVLAAIGFFANLGWQVAVKQESYARRVDVDITLAKMQADVELNRSHVTEAEKQLAVLTQAVTDIRDTNHEIRDSLKGFNRAPSNRGKPTPFPQVEER